jgi:hypothetical protein
MWRRENVSANGRPVRRGLEPRKAKAGSFTI